MLIVQHFDVHKCRRAVSHCCSSSCVIPKRWLSSKRLLYIIRSEKSSNLCDLVDEVGLQKHMLNCSTTSISPDMFRWTFSKGLLKLKFLKSGIFCVKPKGEPDGTLGQNWLKLLSFVISQGINKITFNYFTGWNLKQLIIFKWIELRNDPTCLTVMKRLIRWR